MTTLSEDYLDVGNTKGMTRMSLTLPELTNLIINFCSTNLKIALKTLQKENFKKHLMTKKILLNIRQPKN